MEAFWRRGVVTMILAVMSPITFAAERPDAPRRFAITGARMFTGTGPAIEGGTVVIEDGLVTAVSREAPAPAGVWIIDASGKTVYPGFIDALATTGLARSRESDDDVSSGDEPAAFPAGPEDRPATTPWRVAADELDADEERLASWRRAGYTTSVTVPEEGIFPGQASVVNLAGERERDMVVATPVALRVNLSPPASRRSFPGSLLGVIAYVKQSFLDAAHYRESWAAYEANPRGRGRPIYDRALEILAKTRAEGSPVLLPAVRRHEILRALEVASEAGIRPVLYGVHEAYAATDELEEARVPVLVSLDWPERDDDADPEEEVPLRVLKLRDGAPTTPATLETAGVRFAFYSDGLEKPEEVLAALREARARGLSEEGAVRALTLAAAEIYGVDDRLGSLERGKIANLVIADGDLFVEGSRVETVFIDGVKFEIREKEGVEE